MSGERRKIHRQIALYYFIVVFICFLDQLSKFCVERFVLQGSSIPVIKNIFHVTLVYNTGAAFGMFNRYPYLFIAVAVLAIVLISYFLAQRSWRMRTLEKVALCFILGGTLGNLIDRLRCGCVIDFIDFRIWPVFNLADSFITIGAVMLGLSILAGIRRSDRGRKGEA
jgi:signal peptidase II